jgi:hypothetical protein
VNCFERRRSRADDGRQALRVILAVIALMSIAEDVFADECDVRAAELVRQVGASIHYRGAVKIFLNRPPLQELYVSCYPQIGLIVGWAEKTPPDEFFKLAAVTGAIVTGIATSAIEAAAIECHKAALRVGENRTDLQKNGLIVSCQADKLGTTISIRGVQ